MSVKNEEEMNEREKEIAMFGESGQGEYLVEAKMKKNSLLPTVILPLRQIKK
jgi:hypothetical protein